MFLCNKVPHVDMESAGNKFLLLFVFNKVLNYAWTWQGSHVFNSMASLHYYETNTKALLVLKL